MRIQTNTLALLCITALFIPVVSCNTDSRAPKLAEDETWQQTLARDLHLLGHRNWILVVDKAFPEQSSPGMKYIYVEQDLIPTLAHVLTAVESSTHVKPLIYRDRELAFITEEQVPGIETFRRESSTLLEDREVLTLLHDDVFALLDNSASLFRVLVIKTNCTLPYTSVFLQLDCAYWNSDQEKALRESMPPQD
ncbi:MAG: hypothetical protein V2B15_08010 [Bacteroidota bacterium]